MNQYVKHGQCPHCFGHGWITSDAGDSFPCDHCTGTGTLTGMWSTHAEALNIRAEHTRGGGAGSPEKGDQQGDT